MTTVAKGHGSGIARYLLGFAVLFVFQAKFLKAKTIKFSWVR